jgi:poly(ribitol-phosphate) beta-N-acetylglucosaminyltransferase
MAVDVTVIVPFFNPGANIEDCLQSLVDQTLPRDRFEVVLVDDGSTDGSADRVVAWMARYPDLMQLHRIPASGGPGRPRNVAMDNSDSRFIQFLDADDTLAPRALERMLEIADSSDAEVVVGKLTSDFRGIHHPMFRKTVTRRTLDNFPLMRNLTVCKMFRREFMRTHHIRFPEGVHYSEDQHICIESYARATSVAVVGDIACYFYRRRRTGGRNWGDTAIALDVYYREQAAILDVVDNEVPSTVTQIAIKSRFYRNEMLGRLRGHAMLGYEPDYRRELVSRIRRLAATRLPPELYDELPAFYRTQSRLLLDDNVDGLMDFAGRLGRIRLRATTTAPVWRDGALVVDVDAPLSYDDEPFRFEHDSGGWLVPEWLAPGVGAEDRRLRGNEPPDLDLALISRTDSQLWSTTEGLAAAISDDGSMHIHGSVTLDPSTVMGGTALTPGVWNLRLRVTVEGLSRTSPVRPKAGTTPVTQAWLATAEPDRRSVTAFWAESGPSLSLDVDEWCHSLDDLVGDPSAAVPYVDRHRRLVIAVAALRGPDGERASVTLILSPLEDPDVGVVHCAADLLLTPTGATIETTVPDLPAGSARWAIWLRIGDVGGSPARRLPVELQQARFGKLRVSPAG